MSGAPQTMSRREALLEWNPEKADEYLWLVDWASFGLPYCSVYVIAPEGHWPSKIGISKYAKKRVQTLQTSHWKLLVVSKCFWCKSAKEARAVEQKVHEMLREDGSYLLGEWFDKRPKQAAEMVEFAGSILGIELHDRIENDEITEAVREIVWKEWHDYSTVKSQTAWHGRDGLGPVIAFNGRVLT